MKTIILKAIEFYRKYLSFDTGVVRFLIAPLVPIAGRVCRHFPTCSQYTQQMVEKYGVSKGLWMGFVRLSKCHPWGTGDYNND